MSWQASLIWSVSWHNGTGNGYPYFQVEKMAPVKVSRYYFGWWYKEQLVDWIILKSICYISSFHIFNSHLFPSLQDKLQFYNPTLVVVMRNGRLNMSSLLMRAVQDG